MAATGAMTAYPWRALRRVSKAAVNVARDVARALGPHPNAARVARALGELLGSDVAIVIADVAPASAAPFAGTERIASFDARDGSVAVCVDAEPALVTAALARLLGRDPGIPRTTGALDPALRGAIAALVVETARRSDPELLLCVRHGEQKRDPDAAELRIDVTVFVDERPYAATVLLAATPSPTRGALPVALSSLGELPVALQAVAAVSVAARSEIAALRVGDVWLPGAGWLAPPVVPARAPRALFTSLALATASGERGALASISDDGKIVLRGAVTSLLGADDPSTPGTRSEAVTDHEPTLAELALDADVVVRVEVASVTLPARELATLSAGSILGTGVRLAEPVVLRVSGREVARGELVTIDGELGVKIREIVGR